MKRGKETSWRYRFMIAGVVGMCVLALQLPAEAQKKPRQAKPKPSATKPVDELTRLRNDFVKATNEYKASLEKLRASYEKNVVKAEERLKQSQDLFAEGLISRNDLVASERSLADSRAKITEITQRMSTADTQIAQILVEAETEKKLSRIKIAEGRNGLDDRLHSLQWRWCLVVGRRLESATIFSELV